MNSDLDWVKDVEGWQKDLPDNFRDIISIIGENAFLMIWPALMSTTTYWTEKPLDKIRAKYIRLNYQPGKAGKIARRIGCSEKFVFDNMPNTRKIEEKINQMNMFNEGSP